MRTAIAVKKDDIFDLIYIARCFVNRYGNEDLQGKMTELEHSMLDDDNCHSEMNQYHRYANKELKNIIDSIL